MSDIKRQLNHLRGDKQEKSASSIKDKLDRLYSRTGSEQKFFVEESVVRSHKRLEELVAGEYVNTPAGDVYRARTTYPLDHQHGTCDLSDFFDIEIEHLLKLGKMDESDSPDLRPALFLDTEASGLSGGSGTYAFMIGVGYFYKEEFIVDQLFVDSYAKEEGMLDLLREYLDPASFLVSFNGKSFDLNLLNTRYLMHRQESPFENIPHLDLLHPSRNLWNLNLENCRLQTLEREIFGFSREDDVPGEEVPGIYFEFIRTGDPTRIAGVFEHNVHDIVSLVAVTIMLEQNFRGMREIPGESGLTMFSRGRIFERRGEIEQAIRCYHEALNNELTVNRRNTILGMMASLYKKEGDWEHARNLWQQQISQLSIFTLEPYVEIAKYYEHQEKDYATALSYINEALQQLPTHRSNERDTLIYRTARLERRLENAQ